MCVTQKLEKFLGDWSLVEKSVNCKEVILCSMVI